MSEVHDVPPQEESAIVPQGLVRIQAEDTLYGWKLVEINSDEHKAALPPAADEDAPAAKKKGR